MTPIRFLVLIIKYLFAKKHDVIFVPLPSHIDGALAVVLAKLFKKKLIMDYLYGLYDTVIIDRELFNKKGFLQKLLFHYERWLTLNSDCCLTDTKQHKTHLANQLDVPVNKFEDIPVGINERFWLPCDERAKKEGTFKVLLWSTFIPLHGVDVVVKAAKIIENESIEVLLIGNGQTGPAIENLIESLGGVSNLSWNRKFVDIDEIKNALMKADVCLGVFSEKEKTDRVIPYKVYQSLASKKPLITAKTTAISDVLINAESAILVNPNRPQELADAIVSLSQNPKLSETIASGGHNIYKTFLSNEVIGSRLNNIILKLISYLTYYNHRSFALTASAHSLTMLNIGHVSFHYCPR